MGDEVEVQIVPEARVAYMRYVGPYGSPAITDLWRRSAGHANAMASRLADGVRGVVEITQPVQANAVFAILPHDATVLLQRDFKFYVWNEHTGEVRWMCSWDTTEEDVDAFIAAVKNVVAAAVQ